MSCRTFWFAFLGRSPRNSKAVATPAFSRLSLSSLALWLGLFFLLPLRASAGHWNAESRYEGIANGKASPPHDQGTSGTLAWSLLNQNDAPVDLSKWPPGYLDTWIKISVSAFSDEGIAASASANSNAKIIFVMTWMPDNNDGESDPAPETVDIRYHRTMILRNGVSVDALYNVLPSAWSTATASASLTASFDDWSHQLRSVTKTLTGPPDDSMSEGDNYTQEDSEDVIETLPVSVEGVATRVFPMRWNVTGSAAGNGGSVNNPNGNSNLLGFGVAGAVGDVDLRLSIRLFNGINASLQATSTDQALDNYKTTSVPHYWSGTGCLLAGSMEAGSQQIYGWAIVLENKLAYEVKYKEGRDRVDFYGWFDSTQFRDKNLMKAKLYSYGPTPEVDGPVGRSSIEKRIWNKGYAMGSKLSFPHNAPDAVLRVNNILTGQLQAGDPTPTTPTTPQPLSYSVRRTLIAAKPEILDNIPDASLFYAYTHGIPDAFADCQIDVFHDPPKPAEFPHLLFGLPKRDSLDGQRKPFVSDMVAKKRALLHYKRPQYNLVFLDGCKTSVTSELSSGFGIDSGSHDRAYLGWDQNVQDKMIYVDFIEYLLRNLANGETVKTALKISIEKYRNRLFPTGAPRITITGDPNMKLHGAYGTTQDEPKLSLFHLQSVTTKP